MAEKTTIYLDDAINLLEELETKRLQGDVGLLYASMIKGLKALPSAQPERKKGKWIKYEQEFMLEGQLDTVQKTVMECSTCTRKISGMVGFMNFCPNCGADMREDGEADADVKP